MTSSTNTRKTQKNASSLLITKGPLNKAIWYLAAPELVSQVLRWTFLTVDTYFVGRLGKPQLAALSGISFSYWALQALGLLLSIGVISLVARYTGAQKPKEAQLAATQGVLWVLPYGLCVGISFAFLASPLLSWVASSETAAKEGAACLQIIALSAPLLYLGYVVDAAFRGSGDPKTPLFLLGCAASLNCLLDPILIFSFSLGIKGAAWATVISQSLGALVGFVLLTKRGLFQPVWRFRFFYFLRVCRIGAPIAVSVLLFSSIYLVLGWILKPYGDEALAGLAIGHRVEALPYLVAVGLGTAATTLVGQSLGAKDPSRAKRAAWHCTRYALLVAVASSVIMLLFTEELVGFFSEEKTVMQASVLYITLIAFSQIGSALEIVLEGSFGGAGDTLPPMIISTFWSLLRIPLSFVFASSFGLGFVGVYWAITITALFRGLVMALWFARGKWQNKKLGDI